MRAAPHLEAQHATRAAAAAAVDRRVDGHTTRGTGTRGGARAARCKAPSAAPAPRSGGARRFEGKRIAGDREGWEARRPRAHVIRSRERRECRRHKLWGVGLRARVARRRRIHARLQGRRRIEQGPGDIDLNLSTPWPS